MSSVFESLPDPRLNANVSAAMAAENFPVPNPILEYRRAQRGGVNIANLRHTGRRWIQSCAPSILVVAGFHCPVPRRHRSSEKRQSKDLICGQLGKTLGAMVVADVPGASMGNWNPACAKQFTVLASSSPLNKVMVLVS